MNITVDLSSDELAQLKHATELEDERQAVTKAAREFIRLSHLRELKAASGTLDYADMSDAMETLEFRERPKTE